MKLAESKCLDNQMPVLKVEQINLRMLQMAYERIATQPPQEHKPQIEESKRLGL